MARVGIRASSLKMMDSLGITDNYRREARRAVRGKRNRNSTERSRRTRGRVSTVRRRVR